MHDPEIRSLALRPWGVAAISYLFFGIFALTFHGTLLHAIAPEAGGFWMTLYYGIAWVGVTALLLVVTTGLSIVMALVLSGIFQTEIASHILKRHGLTVPETGNSVAALSRVAIQSIMTEGIKLIWILPLGFFLLLMSLIPIFTIPAAIGGAWLLAYGSFDIVLDAWGTTASQRLWFAMRNGVTLVAFGFIMMGCCVVPLLGLLLPPVAVAGAAHFFGLHQQLLPRKS